jgi:hypothetical protein
MSHSGLLKYHQLCQIEDDLVAILPEGRSVIHARTLISFINHEGDLDQSGWGALKSYLTRKGLIAGMSESRGDDCSLHNLVNQAQIALRIGRRCYPDEVILSFESCRRYCLFDLCLERDDWRRYIHPCLYRISAYDLTASMPLMPTPS